MTTLELRLLGGCEGTGESGRPLDLPTKKAWALLSYLALHPGRQLSRERLATLLWGDRFDEQARRSLRQTLYELRSALGESADGHVAASRDYVAWDGSGFEVDVLRFERLAADGGPEALAEAESLYRGPLLEGLETGEQGFDDWLAGERARLHELACRTLERLAADRLDRGAVEPSLASARRLLKLNSFHEGGHRLLMRGLAASGQRNEALKHYEDLKRLLRAELDAMPEAETAALRESIRQGNGGDARPPGQAQTRPAAVAQAGRAVAKRARATIGLAGAVVMIGVAAVSYFAWRGPERLTETASEARMAYPLPGKPSIAVLPFENLSDERQQDYLADGLTEDLITALSKAHQLFVIARTSVAGYKGKPVKVQKVAEELGVRYILEGSVQKSGEDLRITVQLIDAVSGHHLWGDRFDREAKQIFVLQDDIVRRVLIELEVKLTTGDHARVASRGTTNLDAWLLRVQAMEEVWKFNREGTIRAREILEAAHEADPNWARPLAGMAWSYWWEAKQGWTDDREGWIRKGTELAERAIEMDPEEALGYMMLGNLVQLRGDHDRAIALREKAVALAPNDFQPLWGYGAVLHRVGPVHAARAVEVLKRAERLSPRGPAALLWSIGRAQLFAGHYEDVIETARRLTPRWPESVRPHILMVAAYGALGRMDEAHAAAAEVLRIDPKYTVSVWKLGRREYKDRTTVDRLAGLLAEAGLPE
jgi:TolB-like protein/DNA-binding SARP family transcriptional activator